jgi:hypothetical protein
MTLLINALGPCIPRCHKCIGRFALRGPRGFSLSMEMMILCPDCGNKRCPKASDHQLACTGSNEPGQPGSVFPTMESHT